MRVYNCSGDYFCRKVRNYIEDNNDYYNRFCLYWDIWHKISPLSVRGGANPQRLICIDLKVLLSYNIGWKQDVQMKFNKIKVGQRVYDRWWPWNIGKVKKVLKTRVKIEFVGADSNPDFDIWTDNDVATYDYSHV